VSCRFPRLTKEESVVHIPVALSTMPSNAAGDPAGVANVELPATAVGTLRTDRHRRLGCAYRAGRLICGCVHVTVSLDGRIGLAQHERRLVRVRFHEPLDDDLRTELTQLVRRRGAAARGAVERVDPIEVVVDDPRGERQHIVGHLQPPQMRHGQLRAIEFELKRAR
jgi:hypothetical protein